MSQQEEDDNININQLVENLFLNEDVEMGSGDAANNNHAQADDSRTETGNNHNTNNNNNNNNKNNEHNREEFAQGRNVQHDDIDMESIIKEATASMSTSTGNTRRNSFLLPAAGARRRKSSVYNDFVAQSIQSFVTQQRQAQPSSPTTQQHQQSQIQQLPSNIGSHEENYLRRDSAAQDQEWANILQQGLFHETQQEHQSLHRKSSANALERGEEEMFRNAILMSLRNMEQEQVNNDEAIFDEEDEERNIDVTESKRVAQTKKSKKSEKKAAASESTNITPKKPKKSKKKKSELEKQEKEKKRTSNEDEEHLNLVESALEGLLEDVSKQPEQRDEFQEESQDIHHDAGLVDTTDLVAETLKAFESQISGTSSASVPVSTPKKSTPKTKKQEKPRKVKSTTKKAASQSVFDSMDDNNDFSKELADIISSVVNNTFQDEIVQQQTPVVPEPRAPKPKPAQTKKAVTAPAKKPAKVGRKKKDDEIDMFKIMRDAMALASKEAAAAEKLDERANKKAAKALKKQAKEKAAAKKKAEAKPAKKAKKPKKKDLELNKQIDLGINIGEILDNTLTAKEKEAARRKKTQKMLLGSAPLIPMTSFTSTFPTKYKHIMTTSKKSSKLDAGKKSSQPVQIPYKPVTDLSQYFRPQGDTFISSPLSAKLTKKKSKDTEKEKLAKKQEKKETKKKEKEKEKEKTAKTKENLKEKQDQTKLPDEPPVEIVDTTPLDHPSPVDSNIDTALFSISPQPAVPLPVTDVAPVSKPTLQVPKPPQPSKPLNIARVYTTTKPQKVPKPPKALKTPKAIKEPKPPKAKKPKKIKKVKPIKVLTLEQIQKKWRKIYWKCSKQATKTYRKKITEKRILLDKQYKANLKAELLSEKNLRAKKRQEAREIRIKKKEEDYKILSDAAEKGAPYPAFLKLTKSGKPKTPYRRYTDEEILKREEMARNGEIDELGRNVEYMSKKSEPLPSKMKPEKKHRVDRLRRLKSEYSLEKLSYPQIENLFDPTANTPLQKESIPFHPPWTLPSYPPFALPSVHGFMKTCKVLKKLHAKSKAPREKKKNKKTLQQKMAESAAHAMSSLLPLLAKIPPENVAIINSLKALIAARAAVAIARTRKDKALVSRQVHHIIQQAKLNIGKALTESLSKPTTENNSENIIEKSNTKTDAIEVTTDDEDVEMKDVAKLKDKEAVVDKDVNQGPEKIKVKIEGDESHPILINDNNVSSKPDLNVLVGNIFAEIATPLINKNSSTTVKTENGAVKKNGFNEDGITFSQRSFESSASGSAINKPLKIEFSDETEDVFKVKPRPYVMKKRPIFNDIDMDDRADIDNKLKSVQKITVLKEEGDIKPLLKQRTEQAKAVAVKKPKIKPPRVVKPKILIDPKEKVKSKLEARKDMINYKFSKHQYEIPCKHPLTKKTPFLKRVESKLSAPDYKIFRKEILAERKRRWRMDQEIKKEAIEPEGFDSKTTSGGITNITDSETLNLVMFLFNRQDVVDDILSDMKKEFEEGAALETAKKRRMELRASGVRLPKTKKIKLSEAVSDKDNVEIVKVKDAKDGSLEKADINVTSTGTAADASAKILDSTCVTDGKETLELKTSDVPANIDAALVDTSSNATSEKHESIVEADVLRSEDSGDAPVDSDKGKTLKDDHSTSLVTDNKESKSNDEEHNSEKEQSQSGVDPKSVLPSQSTDNSPEQTDLFTKPKSVETKVDTESLTKSIETTERSSPVEIKSSEGLNVVENESSNVPGTSVLPDSDAVDTNAEETDRKAEPLASTVNEALPIESSGDSLNEKPSEKDKKSIEKVEKSVEKDEQL